MAGFLSIIFSMFLLDLVRAGHGRGRLGGRVAGLAGRPGPRRAEE